MLREHGAFPVSGGWLRQTAKFSAGADFCDRAMGIYEKRTKEKADQEKILQAAMEKAMRDASGPR